MTQVFPMDSAGDQPGRLADMFDAYYNRLYRLARRLAPSADDALDLVQETFLRAARSPNTIPSGDGNEEAWLVRVLVNIRRDQWRYAAVRTRLSRDTNPSGSGSSGAGRNPESAIIARRTVWQAQVIPQPDGKYAILIAFNSAGVQKIYEATENNIGKHMAVLIDGKVVTAPLIQAATGEFAKIDSCTKDDAERIVAGMIMR